MNDSKPRDAWGRVLKVGDLCAYPVRRGSRMWVNRLHVTELPQDPNGEFKAKGTNRDGASVVIANLSNMTIIGRNGMIPTLEN